MSKTKSIVEEYQCPGCLYGTNLNCYEKSNGRGLECSKHVAGTRSRIESFFLGMPKGFNRLGSQDKLKINIFEKFADGWGYDKFNVPVWKYLDEQGNTIVRGISPRINAPFLHVFAGNFIDEINCLEITKADLDKMD